MSTTQVSAGQVMDRAANLLNDPNKTDYTYAVMLPYLNMAIEEFSDLLAEANSPFSNLTNTSWQFAAIILQPGDHFLVPPEVNPPPGFVWPKYPADLIEVQEVGERKVGDTGNFRPVPRWEFPKIFPATDSCLFWVWENGYIRFNPSGVSVPIEVQLKYIYQGLPYVVGPNSMINVIGSRTYLGYKTAAFCAMFIGENEIRAAVLEAQAEKAADRAIAISNKGRQEIPTRHRPFRAAFKARGGF
jgi:hypothetical protein